MSQFKKIAASIAVAVGGFAAAPSWALPPADYDGTVLNVYYGGATATDNVLQSYFTIQGLGACAPGTIDVYSVTAANRNNRVIFCRVTADQVAGFPAAPAGTKVAFHKESIGGSSNGVVPLVNLPPGNTPDNLDFFDMTTAAANCTAGAPSTPTGQNTFTPWACTDVTVARTPHGGISDTEPALSSPAVTAGVTSKPGLAIVFGVPVTLKVYRALQTAQGKPLSDLPADAPSLTHSQIRGLYTGRISAWSQIRTAANATLTSVAPSGAPVNAATGLADDRVFICRRVSTSGTQASFESYWLQQRCISGAPQFSGGLQNVGTTPAAQGFNQRQTPNEGSGDVRSCMNAHDTNGTWAIGVLSTEVTSGNVGSWRMVAVDGALPNLASVANGDYDFFTENTLNRSSGITLPPLVNSLLLDIENNIGRPDVIKLVNIPFQGRSHGDGGVLTLASAAAFPPNTPAQVDGAGVTTPLPGTPNTMRGNPVNTQTRTVGVAVNNCAPPIMTDPSPTP